MRRVGSRETRDPADAIIGLCRVRVTLVIALACTLTAPAAATAATTIDVTEEQESATFVTGGQTVWFPRVWGVISSFPWLPFPLT